MVHTSRHLQHFYDIQLNYLQGQAEFQDHGHPPGNTHQALSPTLVLPVRVMALQCLSVCLCLISQTSRCSSIASALWCLLQPVHRDIPSGTELAGCTSCPSQPSATTGGGEEWVRHEQPQLSLLGWNKGTKMNLLQHSMWTLSQTPSHAGT